MGDILKFEGLHKKRLINSAIYGKMYIRHTAGVSGNKTESAQKS